jgi:alcohol dehydrogenase
VTAVRAAVLDRVAEPGRAADAISIQQVDLAAPGPGEVLVEVVSASLCHSDLSVMTGDRPRPLPMVLGHEAAGIVAEIGSDVDRVAVGDHVVFTYVPSCGQCRSCLSGRPVLCSEGNQANRAGTLLSGERRLSRDATSLHHHLGVSAFADATVVDQASLIPVARDLDLGIAALFGCAVLTGAGAVLNAARVDPGTSAVVFGCGGVGLAAVLGFKAVGAASVIAVDRGAAQRQLAADLGADHCLEAGPDVVEQIKELTGGGTDVAVDASAALPAIEQAAASLYAGGRLVLLGLPHPDTRWAVSPSALVGNDLTVRGSYMGSSTPARDVPRLIDMYREGRLPVDRLVSRAIGLDDLPSAMADLAAGVPGRIVIRPHQSLSPSPVPSTMEFSCHQP